MRTPTVILALDPSTDVTAAALLRSGPDSCEVLALWDFNAHAAVDGEGPEATFDRMTATLWALQRFVLSLSHGVDLIAYEMPFHRGGAATAALFGSVGLYVSFLRRRLRVPVIAVPVQRVKSQAGIPRGTERARAKKLMIDVVNRRHHLGLTDDQDGRADAVMIGEAAGAISAARAWEESQGILPGLKTRMRRRRKKG